MKQRHQSLSRKGKIVKSIPVPLTADTEPVPPPPAMFYNPFAAQREARNAGKVTELSWFIGEVGICVVFLRNSFVIPLLLQDIIVEWDKPDLCPYIISIPETILLPPKSPIVKIELQTKINPLDNKEKYPWVMRPTGIRFSVYSSSVFIPVDFKGYPTSNTSSGYESYCITPQHIIRAALERPVCTKFSMVSMSDSTCVRTPAVDCPLSFDPITSLKDDEVIMNVSILEEISNIKIDLTSVLTGEKVENIKLHKGESKDLNIILRNEGKLKVTHYSLNLQILYYILTKYFPTF